MQADTTLLDAEYFVPHITQAFADAKTSTVPQLAVLAADPQVAEAVQRLGQWDFTTPTGIAQGYDAGRTPGSPPTQAQIADSVAATIYAVWRSSAVTRIIDDHLGGLPTPAGDIGDQFALEAVKHLLDTFPATHGVGASGIDFLAVPGITDPAASRDYLILSSLRDALTLLASPAFGPAFHQSADQNDYRWGLLHRLVLAHPLGGPFSVPPAFGQFPAPLPGLAGIPVDGGFETVDAVIHPVRAADANGFMSQPRPGAPLRRQSRPRADGRGIGPARRHQRRPGKPVLPQPAPAIPDQQLLPGPAGQRDPAGKHHVADPAGARGLIAAAWSEAGRYWHRRVSSCRVPNANC